MRFYEIISEADEFDDMIEDEADTRGDTILTTTLEELRARASSRGHTDPRVRVDALVNLVKRLPSGETFSASALEAARKSNPNIKNLIKDIKDDDNGVKYVYLTTDAESETGENPTADADSVKSQKVVDQMATRAAG